MLRSKPDLQVGITRTSYAEGRSLDRSIFQDINTLRNQGTKKDIKVSTVVRTSGLSVACGAGNESVQGVLLR